MDISFAHRFDGRPAARAADKPAAGFIGPPSLTDAFSDKSLVTTSGCSYPLVKADQYLIRLPMTESIAEHFGVWNGRQGAPSPMARVSQLFDVLNKISLDALIKPKSIGERELAAQHMINVMDNDLILLDRGYPAWWLFNLILSMDAQFCARVSCTKWKVVRKFFRSGLPEKIIDLPIHPTSVANCRQMGLDTTSLKIRLVRIENSETVAILATSLIDTQQYPLDIFNELYHDR
jgi:hypothetical protein